MMENIRKYMGRHKIKILLSAGKKKFIEHLESGYVGNQKVGYKKVKTGDRDIVLTRVCRHFDDTEYKTKIPTTSADYTCIICLLNLFSFLVFLVCSNIKLIKKTEVMLNV